MRICYETAPSGGHSRQLAESRPTHKHGIITYTHNTLHVRSLCIISSVCVLMSCTDSHIWTLHHFPARTPCTLLPDRSRNETQIVPSPDLLEIPALRWQHPTDSGFTRWMQTDANAPATACKPHTGTPFSRSGGPCCRWSLSAQSGSFLSAPARVCARPPRFWSSDYLRAKWESGVSYWGSDMIT